MFDVKHPDDITLEDVFDDIVEALESISSFSDAENDIDRIMRFRWEAVLHAKFALRCLRTSGMGI